MKTILIVEDDAILALAEAKSLEGFGYIGIIANSGEKAVEVLLKKDTDISLVLMDIDLGDGMDGTTAARKILEFREVPIVFLTSHSERDIVERVRGITRYGYIIKNSGNFVLQSAIEMAFDLFAAHERVRTGEAWLKTLTRTIPDLVWLKDAEGRYLACNSIFESLLGVPEVDLIGKTDFDFFDKESAKFFRDHDNKAIQLGRPSTNEEWITFANDGHRALLETIKTPMTDGQGRFVGVLGIGRDITERKRLEQALVESEQRVKSKLEAILSPSGDIEALDLSEIIDIPTLTTLMEDFSKLTGMVVAVLDLKGTVLLATGWRDICVKFFRTHPETAASCTESDLFLSSDVKPGEYINYQCKNGLWDIITPLYVESRHVGNIYSGQFFYDDDVVDEAEFLKRAERSGFDTEAFLPAFREVPRFSRSHITLLMDYLVQLTEFISRLSLSNLRLARATLQKGRAEELLSKSLEEKETLLKELQHRVKNSLTIISSILSLAMPELGDDRSRNIFKEAVSRIQSISILYGKLSATGSDRVDLAVYIQDIVSLLGDSYAQRTGRIRVVLRVDATPCDLKSAVPLGLILNELLTNAYKYAYPSGKTGEIRVDLHSDGSGIELTVSDDGPGMPEGFDPKNAKSLGLRIASLFAEELRGELRFGKGPGAKAVVHFPAQQT